MLIQGVTGQQTLGSGVSGTIRQGMRGGDAIVSELHGRFYEQNYNGNLYSYGTTGLTALSANTITLVAATTPIIGVWNPLNSPVNLVILQASLTAIINTLTAPVGAGVFVWATSAGNGSISTGNAPFNRKTLTAVGSQAKGFAVSTALTAITNNLVIQEAADFTSPSGQTYGTIVATSNTITSFGGVQNFDGSLIVPPGGVLALLNTTSTTTMSVVSRLLWEEVAI